MARNYERVPHETYNPAAPRTLHRTGEVVLHRPSRIGGAYSHQCGQKATRRN